MPEMKTLNGYEVVDAKARKDIEGLQEAVAAIPEYDLTPYATETYVDNAIDNIPEVDLSKHALKSELPTKVSQLENDSKFITREEVPEIDLSEYAKKSELPTVPKKVSELTNDTGYITLAEVPKTDLSDYAKKSDIPDVSDFITNIPDEYITESELNAKGYLTEHQDISGKADKVHYHSEYLTEHQSLANYATKKYVDDAIAGIDIPKINGVKSVFIDASTLTGSSTAIPEEYIPILQKYASGEDRDVYFFIKLDENTYFQSESIYIPNEGMLSINLPISYNAMNNPGQLYRKGITMRLDYNPASWWVTTSYNTLTTKSYVDDAIAALEARVAALEGGNN